MQKQKGSFLLLAVAIVAALGVGGYILYHRFTTIPKATIIETSPITIIPQLTYPGAYNGQLYLTGEKTGSEAPFGKLIAGMDRNGVATSIFYFGIEADNAVFAAQNLRTIIETVNDNPGRIVPFFSPGYSGSETAEMDKDELASVYLRGFEQGTSAAAGLLKGIGEIEAQQWAVPLNGTDMTRIISWAAESKLSVMIHTKPEQHAEFEALVAAHPNTTFLWHMFANDFERGRANIIKLIQTHKNVVYSIDADHLMFDSTVQPPIGLLYKYQDADSNGGVTGFTKDLDAKFDTLLISAVNRYKPLVDAVPSQITIGTEASTDYSFEPAVFDGTVKYIRHFISKLNPAHQEDVAHSNALRLFGRGLTVK